jgi:organic radical activating enzyme
LNKGYIHEIFPSYQGEGKYIGARQLFIRFSKCSIGCIDCDTDNSIKDYFFIGETKYKNPISPEILYQLIIDNFDLTLYHSISITGGEPLEQFEFLKEFSVMLKNEKIKLFIETSGLYSRKLLKIINLFDIFSVDIKLYSVFGVAYDVKSFEIVKKLTFQDVYFKLIISEKLDLKEFNVLLDDLISYNINELYIQPHNDLLNEVFLCKVFDILAYKNIVGYYVPQVHKLVRIR